MVIMLNKILSLKVEMKIQPALYFWSSTFVAGRCASSAIAVTIDVFVVAIVLRAGKVVGLVLPAPLLLDIVPLVPSTYFHKTSYKKIIVSL
jgi:hypothetical protein